MPSVRSSHILYDDNRILASDEIHLYALLATNSREDSSSYLWFAAKWIYKASKQEIGNK